jgi:hypothetical protein
MSNANADAKRIHDVVAARLEADVPMPIYRRKVKFPALYIMDVNQSFLVHDLEHKSLLQAIAHCRRLTNPKRRFSVRRVAHNAYRVWRIE